MSLPSPLFQTLPMLVMENTIEYLLGRPKKSFDVNDIDTHNKKRAILTPLLYVCQSWREAALAFICDNCLLSFNGMSGEFEVMYPAWPVDFLLPHFPRDSIVSQVVVTAPRWFVMSHSEYIKTITRSIRKAALFPSATTLVLVWGADSAEKRGRSRKTLLAAQDDVTKMVEFARCLRRVTPALTRVVVSFGDADPVESGYTQLRARLVAELCQGGITRLEAQSMNNALTTLDSMPITGLTSLAQKANMVCAPFAELAYRNVGTLKTLCIRASTEADWQTLIYGGTNTSVVYAHLTLLALGFGNIKSGEVWAKFEGVTPFPYLSTLDISDEYPFDDDLPFRGNDETLQNLRIPFRALIKNVLGRHEVLSRSGVTRMNSVRIYSTNEPRGMIGDWVDNGVIECQVRRITEVATALFFTKETWKEHMFKAICSAPATAILRHFDCRYKTFKANHIIEVISALPSLISLTCATDDIGRDLERIPVKKLLSTLRERHYPLSSAFRKLIVFSVSTRDPGMELARIAMIIATICPNLASVYTPIERRVKFRRAIATAIKKGPFRPFRSSFRHLI
ncbi:hypothetical protein GGF42_001273 [Coemansia sp. RSA 2424]|nr:hypothetical protein GGF42_001273 [Coemansia sp. RSA 2424]